MVLLLYNVALVAGLLLSAPWWLLRMATTQKYREGLAERLGSVRRMRRQVKAVGRPVIWVHAVSVGEVLAVSRFITELAEALPGYRVVVSTTTRTGQQLARQRFGAERVFYCPLDLPWAVNAWLAALQPAMLVLAETEFWPNLLRGCFRRNIPVAVINARISDRSWPRYWRLRRLWKPILSRLRAVLAQTELDAGRLRALGCALDRVTVSGNLKFDVRIGEQTPFLRQLRAMAAGRRLLVAGSTLDGEEQALLAAWPRLLAVDPGLAMVLAPRHPERFDAVARLLEESIFPWRRRSTLSKDAAPLAGGEILVLDSIGELAAIYGLGAVAYVGGSLVPAGGHNPLEPAQFGVPVVMGEHVANFRAIVDLLLAAGGIIVTRPQELEAAIARLLENPSRAEHVGRRGRRVFEQQAGATGRSVDALRRLLGEQAQSDRKQENSAHVGLGQR